MIRKSYLLALALTAVAVAAPIAQSATGPSGNTVADPLAVSYLRGQGMSPGEIKAATEGVDPLAASYLRGQGLSPSQIAAWTSGVCSGADRPASCYQGNAFGSVEAKVDPLAVSYLTGQGLSPSEVTSWTAGACSHQVRAASCYAMFERAAAPTQAGRSVGFQWGDAGIGAGATLGLILLVIGGGAGLFISRQSRRRQVARA
jgi:hypothetical protein